MSVVIKLDMPKSCGICPIRNGCQNFADLIKGSAEIRCDIVSEGCPIIYELPEKHGRLIGADAIDWWKGEDAEENLVFILDKVDINKEPTIVEAEGENA